MDITLQRLERENGYHITKAREREWISHYKGQRESERVRVNILTQRVEKDWTSQNKVKEG